MACWGEIKGNKKLEQIFEKVMSNESQNKLMKQFYVTSCEKKIVAFL